MADIKIIIANQLMICSVLSVLTQYCLRVHLSIYSVILMHRKLTPLTPLSNVNAIFKDT